MKVNPALAWRSHRRDRGGRCVPGHSTGVAQAEIEVAVAVDVGEVRALAPRPRTAGSRLPSASSSASGHRRATSGGPARTGRGNRGALPETGAPLRQGVPRGAPGPASCEGRCPPHGGFERLPHRRPALRRVIASSTVSGTSTRTTLPSVPAESRTSAALERLREEPAGQAPCRASLVSRSVTSSIATIAPSPRTSPMQE